eukprot:jgi/Bigna1/85293/estExt_fgenesh1_pg.C_30161
MIRFDKKRRKSSIIIVGIVTVCGTMLGLGFFRPAASYIPYVLRIPRSVQSKRTNIEENRKSSTLPVVGRRAFTPPPSSNASFELMADAYDDEHKRRMLQSSPMALVCMVMGTNASEMREAACAYAEAVGGSVQALGPLYKLFAKNYQHEFGEDLWKQGVLVLSNFDPAEFVRMKHKSLEVERKYSQPIPQSQLSSASIKDVENYDAANEQDNEANQHSTNVTGALSTSSSEQSVTTTGSRMMTKHRRVNIDPGILSLGSLHLVSTKYAPHRLCIAPLSFLSDDRVLPCCQRLDNKGLWSEIELYYEDGAYKPLPWTYPDFRTDEMLEFFKTIRQHHLRGKRPHLTSRKDRRKNSDM